jgi:dihydrofolate reductase
MNGARRNATSRLRGGAKPKWVVSHSLKSVGANAILVEGDIEAMVRGLKAEHAGEIEVAGPELAQSLTDLGLIDEYRLYFHPVVLCRGKPFFAGPRPPLRLVASDRIGEDTIRLTFPPKHAARPTDCANTVEANGDQVSDFDH